MCFQLILLTLVTALTMICYQSIFIKHLHPKGSCIQQIHAFLLCCPNNMAGFWLLKNLWRAQPAGRLLDKPSRGHRSDTAYSYPGENFIWVWVCFSSLIILRFIFFLCLLTLLFQTKVPPLVQFFSKVQVFQNSAHLCFSWKLPLLLSPSLSATHTFLEGSIA